jgi:hypothetical protein
VIIAISMLNRPTVMQPTTTDARPPNRGGPKAAARAATSALPPTRKPRSSGHGEVRQDRPAQDRYRDVHEADDQPQRAKQGARRFKHVYPDYGDSQLLLAHVNTLVAFPFRKPNDSRTSVAWTSS